MTLMDWVTVVLPACRCRWSLTRWSRQSQLSSMYFWSVLSSGSSSVSWASTCSVAASSTASTAKVSRSTTASCHGATSVRRWTTLTTPGTTPGSTSTTSSTDTSPSSKWYARYLFEIVWAASEHRILNQYAWFSHALFLQMLLTFSCLWRHLLFRNE